ncbi:MAG: hypothetical protein FWD68_19410 [Alphaproteobacteria bacterium]|nr:hypothetical protein [Alphaproteobacteria bacterium]
MRPCIRFALSYVGVLSDCGFTPIDLGLGLRKPHVFAGMVVFHALEIVNPGIVQVIVEQDQLFPGTAPFIGLPGSDNWRTFGFYRGSRRPNRALQGAPAVPRTAIL